MKKVLSIIVSPVYALEGVIYDNSASGSSATNVNDALNDLYSKLNEKQTEINNIKNIGNATADKILSGYTAYVKGNTITGSIPSKGATTYTPGTSNQTIASGQYLSGAQTIKGDSNLVAANIAKGKSIFGISGTYTSDANAVAGNILSGKTAYVNGSKITGTLKNLTTSTSIQHATNNGTRVVAGDAGYVSTNTDGVSRFQIRYNGEAGIIWGNTLFGLEMIKVVNTLGINASKVAKGQTIAGISGTYTSDANAVAGNILSGKTAYVNGSKITGSMPSRSATTYTPGTSNQTIASGQYLSGAQTIKGDANLVAANIAKGKSIFGISGTYTSDATATAADIKSGKTAYVNGSKITGTASGGDAKVYKFTDKPVTIPSGVTLKYGSWVSLNSDKDTTYNYSIDLGFTPSEVVACELEMRGNYSSGRENLDDHNFRFSRGYASGTTNPLYWYFHTLVASLKSPWLDTTDAYGSDDGYNLKCRQSGNKLKFSISKIYYANSDKGTNLFTRADELFLSGTLVYK